MENTIYFKDISNCDKNNYPNKIYRVEHSKMLIEISVRKAHLCLKNVIH